MSRPCLFIQPSTGVTRVEYLDICPQVSADGSLVYTLLSQSELDKVMATSDLFGFDPALFGKLVVYFILLFLSGYFGGLMARKLGR
ncbi:hypothetical protein [Aeromonas salmonicida]|uniref:hypothetical protein n=1 Tax=Aeromonas salmonicida TaxID=645 RepID=UPI000A6530EA|nr:hypothetical protein [Aeromonas salmonicida]MDE7526822.1 hypothetical protein [Aeromonas salmonicida]MDE7530858.1 hypothetical protein [Aeromonas salmonicida]MDE7530869.1 hypothetical protein [Aeromonas salmonicida]